MVGSKLGNGGNGQEAYSTENGQYVSEGLTIDKIKENILDGKYGSKYRNIYMGLNVGKRKLLLNKMYEYVQKRDGNTVEEEYHEIEPDEVVAGTPIYQQGRYGKADGEFDKLYNECMDALNNATNGKGQEIYDEGIDGAIVGRGTYCFEFNKFLRLGEEEYLKRNPNETQQQIDDFKKRIEALDITLDSYRLKENTKFYRLVDDHNYLLQTFPDLFKDLSTHYDQYNNLVYNRDDISVDELVKRLKECVNETVSDKSYCSCGAIADLAHSHMLRSHKNPDDYRRVAITILAKKGSRAFYTHNISESEVVLPRDIKFVLKGVEKDKDPWGNERVHLTYGYE